MRIFERLRDEYGFTGSRRSVSELVREFRNSAQRPGVFCPIEHHPGQEVQIDWGEAQIVLGGVPARLAYDNLKTAMARVGCHDCRGQSPVAICPSHPKTRLSQSTSKMCPLSVRSMTRPC